MTTTKRKFRSLKRTFFKRFPEGTYEVSGRALDGTELESEMEVTHVMPVRPCSRRCL